MTYIPVLKSQQKLAENIAQLQDPSLSSNWVLIKKVKLNNQILDETIEGLSRKDKLMVRSKITGALSLLFRPNNDSAVASYASTLHSSGTTHVSNDTFASTAGGMVCGIGGTAGTTGGHGFNESIIDLNNKASSITHIYQQVSTTWRGTHLIGSAWNNLVSEITFAKITTTDVTTGEVEVYKWQDIKPVELHSYELVKEYNLNNQIINESINWDGDVDDKCIIEFIGLNVAQRNNFFLRLNNDSSNSYIMNSLYSSLAASSVSNGRFTDNGIFPVISGNEGINFITSSKLELYTKSKVFNVVGDMFFLGSYTYQNTIINVGKWTNAVDKVTSIQLISTTNVSGTIKIYKLAKSHLVCQTPGLIQGMWQKSIDNDTIEINPGSLEIAGVICNQTSKKQITLSGNLRNGETELANTYYYLYAIQGLGRTLSYKFSSIAPLMDRFSNIISSFDDCDSNQSWHHPNEGIAWRYIGQVYNNASSNIVPFDKCYPGYWESSWLTLPGNTNFFNLNHSFGKNKYKNINILAKNNVSEQIVRNVPKVFSDVNDVFYGYLILNNTTITSNIKFYERVFTDGTWKTAGIYKVIME